MRTDRRIDPRLLSIFERATYLSERAAEGNAVRASFCPQAIRARWIHLVASGNEAEFTRFLSLAQLSGTESDMGWFYSLIRFFDTNSSASVVEFPFKPSLVPFSQVYDLFVLSFRETAAPGLEEFRGWVRPEVFETAEDTLRERLGRLAGRIIYQRFQAERRSIINDFDLHFPANPKRDDLYRSFVARQATCEYWLIIFDAYPVLARLMFTTIILYSKYVTKLVRRAVDERKLVNELVTGSPGDPGRVSNVAFDKSDLHFMGESVATVEWESGLSAIYKPKSLATSAFVAGLLERLASMGAPNSITVPRTLDLQDHGWQEKVVFFTEVDASDYYRRCGRSLFLLQALNAEDMHHENLVCTDSGPCVVDLETILLPNTSSSLFGDETEANVLNVLRTGMLPSWQIGAFGEAYDVSFFGCDESRSKSYSFEANRLNSDYISFNWVRKDWSDSLIHVPRSISEKRDDEVLAGFAEMSSWFTGALQTRPKVVEEAISPTIPLTTRIVFRPTIVYALAFRRATDHENLRDGRAFEVELHSLYRVLLQRTDTPVGAWLLVASEISQLLHGDIPYFSQEFAGSDVYDEGGSPVVRAPGRSGSSELKRSISLQSSVFHEQQKRVVETALAIRRRPSFQDRDDDSDLGELGLSEMKSAVGAIAALIAERSLPTERGPAWFQGEFEARAQAYQMRKMGSALYSGSSGVLLFLALADKFGFWKDDGTLTSGIAQLKRDFTNGPWRDRFVSDFGLGLTFGISSVAYSISCLADVLLDEELLSLAVSIAEGLRVDAWNREASSDVCSGVAGGILLSCKIMPACRSGRMAETVSELVRILVSRKVRVGENGVGWPSALGSRPLAGFAHGSSGIIHALARASKIVGPGSVEETVFAALRYERSLYNPRTGAWQDFRTNADGHVSHGIAGSWCTGAAGIGLARLSLLRLGFRERELRGDLEAAVRSVLASQGHGASLCCGLSGRWHFMLEAAAQERELIHLHSAAKRAASKLLRRGGPSLMFNLGAGLPEGPWNLSAFRGYAGVGMAILSLLKHGDVPNVLLFD